MHHGESKLTVENLGAAFHDAGARSEIIIFNSKSSVRKGTLDVTSKGDNGHLFMAFSGDQEDEVNDRTEVQGQEEGRHVRLAQVTGELVGCVLEDAPDENLTVNSLASSAASARA